MKPILIICVATIACVNGGLLKGLLDKKDDKEEAHSNKNPLNKLVDGLDDGAEKVVKTLSNALNIDLDRPDKSVPTTLENKVEVTTPVSDKDLPAVEAKNDTVNEDKNEVTTPVSMTDLPAVEANNETTISAMTDNNGTVPLVKTEEIQPGATKSSSVAVNTDDWTEPCGKVKDSTCPRLRSDSREVRRNFIRGDECPKGFGKVEDGSCQPAV